MEKNIGQYILEDVDKYFEGIKKKKKKKKFKNK